MFKLKDFFIEHLPKFILQRQLKQQNIRKFMFQYQNENNFYQKLTSIAQLINKFLQAGCQIQPTQLINQYLIFDIKEIKKIKENQEVKQKNQVRKAIRQIMSQTSQYYRQAFQLYTRLIYLCFSSKKISDSKESSFQKLFNIDDFKQRQQIKEQIVVLYQQMKIQSMTEFDYFIPVEFMIYSTKCLFESLKANEKTFQMFRDLFDRCNFNGNLKQKVQDLIKSFQKTKNLQQLQKRQKEKKLFQYNTKKQEQKQKQEEKIINNQLKQEPQNHKSLNNQTSIVKNKNKQKKQSKTKQKNHKHIQDYKSTIKRIVSRNNINFTKVFSTSKKIISSKQSIKSLETIQKPNQLYFKDAIYKRSVSERYLPLKDEDQYKDCLVEATPQPKKKMKFLKIDRKNASNYQIQLKNIFSN